MAEVLQTVTAGGGGLTNFTNSEYIMLDGGGVGLMPFAKQVHRGSFTIDGTTGTDTAALRLTLPLPDTVVWQLRTFHFTLEGSDAADWQRYILELYYNPTTTESGASTQLNFPMVPGAPIDVISGGTPVMNLVVGLGDIGNIAAPDYTNPLSGPQGPFNLTSFNDSNADPVIAMRTATAATDDVVGRFAITWLGYSFEQMRSALLHAGFSNRE